MRVLRDNWILFFFFNVSLSYNRIYSDQKWTIFFVQCSVLASIIHARTLRQRMVGTPSDIPNRYSIVCCPLLIYQRQHQLTGTIIIVQRRKRTRPRAKKREREGRKIGIDPKESANYGILAKRKERKKEMSPIGNVTSKHCYYFCKETMYMY